MIINTETFYIDEQQTFSAHLVLSSNKPEVKARVPNRMIILIASIDFKYAPTQKQRQPHDLLLTLTTNDWNQSTNKASESSLFTEVRENVKRQV